MSGGKRPGSGRKAGVPNKATAEIKVLARQYGPQAIEELAILAGLTVKKGRNAAANEQARIAAAKEILDRAYGKSTQPISGDPDSLSAFPDKIEISVVSPTIDRPPDETREEWIARRKRELNDSHTVVGTTARTANGRNHS